MLILGANDCLGTGIFLAALVLGDASSNIRNERWGEIQETFLPHTYFTRVTGINWYSRQKI